MMQGIGPMAAAGGWANRPVQQGLMFSHESSQPAHPLQISWQDGRFPANFINASNVLEYFSNQFNPFYDRTCNNETVKMQRLPVEQIMKMVGIEYALLHCSEPLFVIRKQKRHNPTQVTPIAEYYIIGGTVYQAPDLCSVINSRMVTALNYIRAAFDEAHNCSRYHPSKGYWWEFKGHTSKQVEKKERVEVRSTAFQRSRVDPLLDLLTRKFPPPEIEGENNNLKLPLASQTVGNVPDDAGFETGASVQIAPSNRAPKKTSPQPSDNEPPAKRLKTEP